jgi:hypothetical protein
MFTTKISVSIIHNNLVTTIIIITSTNLSITTMGNQLTTTKLRWVTVNLLSLRTQCTGHLTIRDIQLTSRVVNIQMDTLTEETTKVTLLIIPLR